MYLYAFWLILFYLVHIGQDLYHFKVNNMGLKGFWNWFAIFNCNHFKIKFKTFEQFISTNLKNAFKVSFAMSHIHQQEFSVYLHNVGLDDRPKRNWSSYLIQL